jgi:hypothetical protein
MGRLISLHINKRTGPEQVGRYMKASQQHKVLNKARKAPD